MDLIYFDLHLDYFDAWGSLFDICILANIIELDGALLCLTSDMSEIMTRLFCVTDFWMILEDIPQTS